MKKIISISLCICLVFTSFSLVFAADTPVSDSTTHTRLQTIITWLQTNAPTYNGQSTTNTNLSNIYGRLVATYGGQTRSVSGWVAYCADMLYNINETLTSMASPGGGGVVDVLNNILNELISTNPNTGVVSHFISNLNSNLNTTRSNVVTINGLTSQINTNVASIMSEVLSSLPNMVQQLTSANTTLTNTYNLENNTLPGIYAYSGSIDTNTTGILNLENTWYTLDQLNGMEPFGGGATVTIRGLTSSGGENQGTYNLTNDNWRSNIGRFAYYINNNLVRGVSFITSGFNSTQTRTNWKTLASETYTPTSTTDGIYYWLSSIQTPIARLASVYASDEEIAAREKAADNQSRAVNTFVDPNGSGSLPGASINNLGGLSSSWKTNLDVGVSTSRLFDVFNSSHGTWFSQEIADSLDTTSNNTRKSKTYDTPLLDERINEIYDAIGGDKK